MWFFKIEEMILKIVIVLLSFIEICAKIEGQLD